MNTNHKQVFPVWLAVLFIIALAIALALLIITPADVDAKVTAPEYNTRGGDCLADRATGDMYVRPNWYCLPQAASQPEKHLAPVIAEHTDVVATPAPSQMPIVEPSATEPPTVTETPETPAGNPTSDPTQPTKKAKHPNKGSGNGGENADPGRHPEKGNDDEGGAKKHGKTK